MSSRLGRLTHALEIASSSKRPLRWLGVFVVGAATAGLIVVWERSMGFGSPVFAFNLHFTLMAAAVLVDKLLAPQLDSRRFRVSPREVEIYRRLGVVGFMHLLRKIGWTAAMRDRKVFDGTRSTVSSYERATRHGENAHAVLFLIVLAPLAWALVEGWWSAAFWIGSMNLVFHAYPVMLQRVQRVRLLAILRRLERRSGEPSAAKRPSSAP